LHEFINNERLSRAERLLRETDESILSISERVGFNNVTYFNRLFKERHCVSPIEFRKRERAR
jgi:AraC-like DNA-binding protein